MTVALCANANGTDKLKPLVIGKYLNPRCFKRINRNSLGVMYEANAKAWMTGRVFERWLKAFDQRITGRKVILLIDNAPSHAVNAVELRNTTIRFLPPNTTSRIQPMDADIIMSFLNAIIVLNSLSGSWSNMSLELIKKTWMFLLLYCSL